MQRNALKFKAAHSSKQVLLMHRNHYITWILNSISTIQHTLGSVQQQFGTQEFTTQHKIYNTATFSFLTAPFCNTNSAKQHPKKLFVTKHHSINSLMLLCSLEQEIENKWIYILCAIIRCLMKVKLNHMKWFIKNPHKYFLSDCKLGNIVFPWKLCVMYMGLIASEWGHELVQNLLPILSITFKID